MQGVQAAMRRPAAGRVVLMPSSQFIFCVKAVFDDGSFQWSQPLMVVTLPAKKLA